MCIVTSIIALGMEYNFLKYDLNKIDHLDAAYDTCSVMHYGAYAFSKVQCGPQKWFGSADCDTINTIYLSLCTYTADPKSFRGTHCIRSKKATKKSSRLVINFLLRQVWKALL